MVLVPLPHLTTLTIHLNSSPIGSCLMWKRVTTLALISIELLTLLTNSLKKRTIKEIERAIDEIIRYDFMNIYKKVKRTKTTKADKA